MIERERETDRQAEGEAGSVWGAWRETWPRVSRIMPWAEGSAKPLSHWAALLKDFTYERLKKIQQGVNNYGYTIFSLFKKLYFLHILKIFLPFYLKIFSGGPGWLNWLCPNLDFGSGHDFRVLGSSPAMGYVLSRESAWGLSLSLSQIKSLKKSLSKIIFLIKNLKHTLLYTVSFIYIKNPFTHLCFKSWF